MKYIYSLLIFMGALSVKAAPSYHRVQEDVHTLPLVPSVETMERVGVSDIYDNAAVRCARWLLAGSISENLPDADNREEASEFLLTWMDMTDKVHIILGCEVYPLMECHEVLVAYLAGAALYAMENQTPVYDHSMQFHSLGVAIGYYQSNRTRLGTLQGMDLLTKLRDSGKLDYYLTDIAPMLSQPIALQNNF